MGKKFEQMRYQSRYTDESISSWKDVNHNTPLENCKLKQNTAHMY